MGCTTTSAEVVYNKDWCISLLPCSPGYIVAPVRFHTNSLLFSQVVKLAETGILIECHSKSWCVVRNSLPDRFVLQYKTIVFAQRRYFLLFPRIPSHHVLTKESMIIVLSRQQHPSRATNSIFGWHVRKETTTATFMPQRMFHNTDLGTTRWRRIVGLQNAKRDHDIPDAITVTTKDPLK